MLITIDLDDVLFNTRPLFKQAFKQVGQTYTKYNNWDLNLCYDPVVVEQLFKLFRDDIIYKMPLLDNKIPNILNNLMQRPDLEICFVTERLIKQPEKTWQQLTNAGIKCSFEQVYDREGKKSDILRELKTDLHFDDSPYVISGCLKKNVPIVMISNNATLYNHYLRDKVKHYKNLRTALIQTGIYQLQNKK